jgi:5,5'-dehydrodivanillate O-demethylase
MGNLLRRYWHPIATVVELEAEPVLAVRILGENLALYRNDQGNMGLLAERCPHRGASLAYGIPEYNGLRCPYHGWLFNPEGRCLEQPAEPASSTFNNRIRVPAYPVEELGGLIWAYLGPQPAPLLPHWDVLVDPELDREIGISHLPCNWLQPMENSMDPVHFEWLHAAFGNYVLKRQGKPPAMTARHHDEIAFDIFEYGITKRRRLAGEPLDCDDWAVGHPVIFPNILAVGGSGRPTFQIRVPVDDTHTLHFWYRTRRREPGEAPQETVPVHEAPWQHENGRFWVETVPGQDMMAWISQGPISERTTERLGTSDRGVILYRSLLLEQLERVEHGQEPMGLVRDPAKNEPMIRIPRERIPLQSYRRQVDVMPRGEARGRQLNPAGS